MQGGSHMPSSMIQHNIASAIQFVMHMELGADGTRRLSEIMEIRGWGNGAYVCESIFKWDANLGLVSTGKLPKIAKETPVSGINFPENFFEPTKNVRLSA